MRSNGPDGGFRLIALDDRNDFRPILIPTGFDDSRFFFFSKEFLSCIF